MRAAFGLFTSLPIHADPEEPGVGWIATTLVGLVMGIAWLVFHQLFVRLGGPFVAAGGVLLLHVALTGARPMRGMAGVAHALVETEWRDPDGDRWDDERRPARPLALPGTEGAVVAVVTLMLLVAASLLVRIAELPALLVVVPIAAKSAQALLLRAQDVEVGVTGPTAGHKVAIAVLAVAGMLASPLMVEVIRPERLDATIMGLGYVGVGIGALVAAVVVGLGVRAWLLARFGALDADGWHAVGAVTEVTALATAVSQI